jgi:hypothetical protein
MTVYLQYFLQPGSLQLPHAAEPVTLDLPGLCEPNSGLRLHYDGSVSLQRSLMLSYVGIRLIHEPEILAGTP